VLIRKTPLGALIILFICLNPVLSFGDQSQIDSDPFELKVLTYNIWGWQEPVDIRMKLIAQGIAELDPHIVALQELMESPDSDGSDNTVFTIVNRLEELTGKKWYVYKENSFDFGDSVFGFGILSQYPLFQTGYRFIPRGEFERILQWAQIELPVGFISFYNTHLSYGEQWETRIEQAERIQTFIQEDDTTRLHMSTIMCGDFNAVPDAIPITTFTKVNQDSFWFYDTWDVAHPGEPGYTVPAWAPSLRIDYVFLMARENGIVKNCEIVFAPSDSGGVNPSDHLGVLSTIEYDMDVFDINVLSPVEGDIVMETAPIHWELSGVTEEVAVSIWVSDDDGLTWVNVSEIASAVERTGDGYFSLEHGKSLRRDTLQAETLYAGEIVGWHVCVPGYLHSQQSGKCASRDRNSLS